MTTSSLFAFFALLGFALLAAAFFAAAFRAGAFAAAARLAAFAAGAGARTRLTARAAALGVDVAIEEFKAPSEAVSRKTPGQNIEQTMTAWYKDNAANMEKKITFVSFAVS